MTMLTTMTARLRTATSITRRRRGASRGVRYLVVVAFTMLACIAAGFAGLRVLAATDNLPPPPVNKWLCFDEKALFLKNRAEKDPTFITVGSSVTWRNLNLGVLKRQLGTNERMLNGAPCFLHVDQTFFLTRFYLERYPNVRTVMSVLSIRDFEQCRPSTTAFFDPDTLNAYLDGRLPPDLLYFKNFRAGSFLRDISHIQSMRRDAEHYNTLVMDRYGSGPIQVAPDRKRGVYYGEFGVDPECLNAYTDMATWLVQRGVRFITVLIPMMPAWSERYDPHGAEVARLAAEIRHRVDTAVPPGTAMVIDGTRRFAFKNEDYSDALHLQWSSVPKFMDYIARDIRSMQAKEAVPDKIDNAKL
jgi:hypothetical protein